MPDYIMRWLASRFLDADVQEELGILTQEVRARKMAQDVAMSITQSDTAGPANGGNGAPSPPAPEGQRRLGNGGSGSAQAAAGTPAWPPRRARMPATTRAAAEALTDTPPVVPAKLQGLDLGPACSQCGGMMQRTGSCYTCSSCGNNTGCG
jgi:ribonucleoside-diphosphate reductase alpha chain